LLAGVFVAVIAAVIGAASTGAQGPTPYKLGMFQQGTRSFVGMVILAGIFVKQNLKYRKIKKKDAESATPG
jgi:hypothetical protein